MPVEEVPPDEVQLVQEAARSLTADIRRTLDTAVDLTVSLDDGGSPVVQLSVAAVPLATFWPEARGLARTVVDLAEQVLDSALFDEHLSPWPLCPICDHVMPHALQPQVVRGAAYWHCARTDRALARVGELEKPLPDG